MNDRKPDIDVIGVWKGRGCELNKTHLWDSKARVRVWHGADVHPTMVVFSDIDEQEVGTSITNSSEYIATKVFHSFKLKHPILWFEHYSRCNHSEWEKQSRSLQESVSLVSYHFIENRFKSPRWVYINRTMAEDMIKSSLSMEGYQSLPHYDLENSQV